MKYFLCCGLFMCALMTSGLHAAVKINGSVRYHVSSDSKKVTIGCDRIENTSTENATGSLQVKLWALNAPYRGGGLSGLMLGSFKLEALHPGSAYRSLSQTVAYAAPAKRRAYHLCITVSQYASGGYSIVDYSNFDKPVTLGPIPPLFSLRGPFSWQTNYEAGTIDIKVAGVSHTRTGHTGSLRLSVWATSAPYRGGSINGYQLGYADKKPLDPGYSYTDVHNTAKLKRPPEGYYYVSILLQEHDGSGYMIRSYLAGPKAVKF